MKCWLCFVHLNLNSLPEKVALFGVDWRDRPNCVNCSPTTDVSRWFSMTSCYWRELNVMIRERERESYTEHISWKPGYRLSSTSKSEVIPWDFGNLSFVCLFFFYSICTSLYRPCSNADWKQESSWTAEQFILGKFWHQILSWTRFFCFCQCM